MKAIVLFCILLCAGFFSRAQFFALDLDSVNPYVTALPYPMDSYYRVLCYDQSFPSVPVNRTRIKIYDSLQHYVTTINLLRGITMVNDYPPLLHNKRLLWPANYNDTANKIQNGLVLLELDTAYNFVALHHLSTHAARAVPTGIVGYSTGFVVGEYFNDSAGTSTKLYKLGLNFQKKDSTVFSDELRLKTHRSANNRIIGASDNLSPACTTTNSLTQKITLDSNLVLIDCFNITSAYIFFCYDAGGNLISRNPVRLLKKGIIFPISNYRTYTHGRADYYNCSPPINNKAILNWVFKNNNYSDNSYINVNTPEDTEFPLYNAADCDYYGANTVYVGTIGLNDTYTVDKIFCRPYYSKLKTRISVTRLDTTGTVLWSRQFGGDMNYYARSVAFTKDGGCVVAGSRYDSATYYPDNVFQNFLMKLDKIGNVISVGLAENQLQLNKRVVCFPNPAKSVVQFDLPDEENSSLQISNAMGQTVLLKNNYVSHSPVDLQALDMGMYVYRIVTPKYVYAGKLLKD